MNSETKSDKLHILILTSWFPNKKEPYLGNFVEQYAVALSKHHQVSLLYNDHSTIKKHGVEEQIYNKNLIVYRAYVPKKSGVFYKYIAHKMGLNHLKKNVQGIDLIHAEIGVRDWWHFLSTKKALNLPLIYTEHGSYFTENKFSQLPWFKRLGLKKLLEKSNVRTAVSTLLAKSIQKETSKKIEVVGNFIPNEWFEHEPKTRTHLNYQFLHISTLDKNKNIQGILEASLLLKKAGILDWQFTIVSEENFGEHQKWVYDNGLVDHFVFRGHVPHTELPSLYLDHDCFILNSNRETFSIVNAEALCLGLHLITTKVGFLADSNDQLIDYSNFNSPEHLFELMMLSVQEKRKSGLKGREMVNKFKEDTVITAYEKVYLQGLGK